jgi:hypothetical protein
VVVAVVVVVVVVVVVYLAADSQSIVRLGIGLPFGAHDQILTLSFL